ncbi:MAG: chromosome segregation protein SMC [Acidobacteriaceae bacterium]|nr:chromosome segregation protein SMC [Acidobacteriaceae bacterium]
MLKLKKVQILGFKSFCDRTEVQLTGEGIAAIVGPNGCGKSNISDAITWVLGEQSAKSLRGIKMEDVIFAGTRDRKPTGMAEVSLTLVDPEVYDGQTLAEGEPEVIITDEHPAEVALKANGDWDEAALRAQIAQETEEAVTEAQPGQTYEAKVPKKRKPVLPENATPDQMEVYEASLAEYEAQQAEPQQPEVSDTEAPEGEAAEATLSPRADNVILKIRRRKFGRTPVRAGEVTVTRRLFRSGDSEYLLNGKICRLSDIKDIFMGTGLGGESYAIIGQERIGQLLSSKPHDRRSIIEEAAGITRFKTKKRLAELRLESAKQNLSRVNDIFEEVTRQMGSLKRQAAKAERYREVQTELRGKLRTTLASRLTQMDADQSATAAEIARLAGLIDEQSAGLDEMDAEHTTGVARGYELDGVIREANSRANSSAVELERITARTNANNDRIQDLTERSETGSEERKQAQAQLATLTAELEQQKAFLEGANNEASGAREMAQAQTAQAQAATRDVLTAEATAENQRRQAVSAMQRVSQANNEIAQAEAGLQGLDRENERLDAEANSARAELEQIGQQRGQAKMTFEDVTERLKRLENEIAEVRTQLSMKREEETQSRKRSNELRAEMATLTGRHTSLEALINEHSYSTDTVRNIFRANQKRNDSNLAPVGTLADFLEVDGKYEQVVDEFLRDELNYIVVKSWDAAEAGMAMLQSEVEGRATFLVHPNDAQSTFPIADGMSASSSPNGEGVVALKDTIRVLDGFGKSLEVILPRLREGFIAPDNATARALALANPQSFFLGPNGETFNNVTVTGGRPRSQGPLALKRELAEVQTKLDAVEAELSRNETATLTLTRDIAELTAMLENKQAERRDAERESANQGAALRQMESEASRIQSRLQQYELAQGRNKDQRTQREELIGRKRADAERFAGEQTGLEQQVEELTARISQMRADREDLQAAASEANAMLAGIEERRRNANATFEQTNRLFQTQQQRIQQLDSQLANAQSEKARREEENIAFESQHTELTEMRQQAVAESEVLSAEASTLRARIGELDTKLRALRGDTEGLREQRSTLTAKTAKLTSDIEYLEATCLNDLGVEASALREDESIERIEGDALTDQEESARTLKGRLEAMGPVNMMALEEYAETAQRHEFLETQRTDLIDSIENTQASIKEIDEISREKFEEAFKVINDNFSTTFTKLFGGGQAFMKLTDPEANGKSDLSGIDIIASPPGKKLQNVLLLSGGEKALTALSLLVGIFQFQPAPFCILDEVDAPLDETNVGRFARLISDMSSTTQFVVITHSKRTMEQADVMYGVTMQEPGVSKIVSVSLGGRSQGKESRSAQQAA